MGYRGKLVERERARKLRARGDTLVDIADKLGVAKSSVSLWVRDVTFQPRLRLRARRREPNALQRRKQEEIDRLLTEGRARIGRLSEREFLVAGAALYAGEGAKTDGDVRVASTDPRIIVLFCAWLRRFFSIDEERLRVRLYLHEGLDLARAEQYWSELTGIPLPQFVKAYRATPHPSIRTSKHPMGCPVVVYSCSRTHRAVMGLVSTLLTSEAVLPG
jgi:transcriptional regulator with XRE-family HTH domain